MRFLVAIAATGETEVTQFLRQRLSSAAGIIEKHLTARPFMVGDGPTIAEISLSGYLFHPETYGVDWAQYPAMGAWLKRLAALPGWKSPYEMIAKAAPRRA